MAKKIIRITESDIHNIVKNVINEIDNATLGRAIVGANVDSNDLNSSDEQLAKNRVGKQVHRDTQKKRRDRQIRAFSDYLSNKMSRELRRDAKIGLGHGSSYYGEIGAERGVPFHHYANVDGSDPTSVFHNSDDTNVRQSSVNAANKISDFVDAMAGYHDKLTNGAEFNNRLNHINDRINDVDNLNKYRRDKEDYENRVQQNEKDIDDFKRLPWYKKIGKKEPQRINAEPPQQPKVKTGVYFMPNETDGLMKQAERYKSNRDKNLDAYNRLLKKR